MARLTALGMIVLAIVRFVVELWGYWKMASSARSPAQSRANADAR
ncbi:hypothetical protein [Mesorhizobium sp. BH1-1-5]|nr:hypothetical protein [Mesorhizobium sp. BH1-1-5]